MAGMIEYYVMGAALWILAAAYMVWRIRRSMRLLLPTPPELTWLIYLVIFTLFALPTSFVGRWNRTAGIVLLALAFVVSLILSYQANARYRAWLKEEMEKREEEEAAQQ